MNVFSRCAKSDEWRFLPEKIAAHRLCILEQGFPFPTIIRRIVHEMSEIKFHPKEGDIEAKHKKRAEFFFRVDAETLDVFFNSRQGYRAQYYLNPQLGIDCNRHIIATIKDKLIEAARRTSLGSMTMEQVENSLEFESAKIWIDEDRSTLNQTSCNPEEILALEVPRWVETMNRVVAAWNAHQQPTPTIMSRALLGVQAPEGHYMKVLGAWLDVNDREFVVPSKIDRGQQIHNYGFS